MEPQAQRFSDADLIAIANDPRVTPEDIAKLTPDEQRRFMAVRQQTPAQVSQRGALQSVLEAAKGAATGAAKGVGESIFHLGDLMKGAPSDLIMPGLSSLTDMKTLGDIANRVGPEGTNATQAFAHVLEELQPQGKAETIGKTAEQIGEFFIPAGKVGPAARGAAEAVTSLTKAAGPARRMLTDAAWKLAPVVDDAIGASAVSMAHGDTQPQYAAAGSAAGNLLGQAASQATKLITKSGPAAFLAALAAGKGAEMLGLDDLDAMLTGGAAFGATKQALRSGKKNPAALAWALEELGRRMGAFGAGAIDAKRTPDEAGPRRRQP